MSGGCSRKKFNQRSDTLITPFAMCAGSSDVALSMRTLPMQSATTINTSATSARSLDRIDVDRASHCRDVPRMIRGQVRVVVDRPHIRRVAYAIEMAAEREVALRQRLGARRAPLDRPCGPHVVSEVRAAEIVDSHPGDAVLAAPC